MQNLKQPGCHPLRRGSCRLGWTTNLCHRTARTSVLARVDPENGALPSPPSAKEEPVSPVAAVADMVKSTVGPALDPVKIEQTLEDLELPSFKEKCGGPGGCGMHGTI